MKVNDIGSQHTDYKYSTYVTVSKLQYIGDHNIFFHPHAGRVPNSSKIYQNIDDDNVGFACPVGFVPIFIDEALADMEPELRAEAGQVCGDDISCLFDIAATKDVSIGASTLSEITTINNEISQVGMYLLLMVPCRLC